MPMIKPKDPNEILSTFLSSPGGFGAPRKAPGLMQEPVPSAMGGPTAQQQSSLDILRSAPTQANQRQQYAESMIGEIGRGDRTARDAFDTFLAGEELQQESDPFAQRYKAVGEMQNDTTLYNDPTATAMRNDQRSFDLAKEGEAARVAGLSRQKEAAITAQGDVDAAAQMAGNRRQVPMPAGIIQQLAGGETALDSLNKIKANYRDEYVGPAAGRWNSFLQQVPLIPADKGFAGFDADTQAVTNATIKAVTGAQMSEPEAQRIKGQIPLTTDKPEVWHQKWDALNRAMRGLNIRMGLIQQGVPIQDLNSIPVEQLADMYGFEAFDNAGDTDWEDVN
jgi:hypothetical protein